MTAVGGPAVGGELLLDAQLLDPRELTAHPLNVRADLGDLSGLTDSIREQGVIEPLIVVPTADGHAIVAGHRRAAAAIAAELERVPCIVRGDLKLLHATDDAQTAEHVGAMLSENLHREGLTAVEESRGVKQMLDLGMKLSQVAKRTGLGQKRVKLAIGVTRLDDESLRMVDDYELDLEQAAAVALFQDDGEAIARLVTAAKDGPGRFAHALERAKQDKKAQDAYLARRAELEASGVPLVETAEWSGRKNRRVDDLHHNGKPLTQKAHTNCPGRATFLGVSANGPYEVQVCTDYVEHGHTDRFASSSGPTKPETEEEKEAATAERRRVIDNNKAMAAANSVRRAFVKELLARRSAPPEVLRFAVEEIAARPQVFSWWLMGNSAPGDKDAPEQLGLEQPVRPWSAAAKSETRTTLTNGDQVPDGRLPLQLLAHVAGAIELGIGKDAWRATDDRRDGLVRWLRFLTGQGYTLSDIERSVVDGAEQ